MANKQDIEWHPSNICTSSAECARWLCIRVGSAEEIKAITLSDGEHHYFESISVLAPNGVKIGEVETGGAGPYLLRPTSLQNRVIVAKIVFLAYVRDPAIRRGERETQFGYPSTCGFVSYKEGFEDPIIFYTKSSTKAPKDEVVATTATDAFIHLTPTITRAPLEISPRPYSGGLELAYMQSKDVTVTFLLDEKLPHGLRTGQVVDESDISLGARRYIVPAGEREITPPPSAWLIALPLLFAGRGKWLIGRPHLASKPYSNLRLSPIEGGVHIGWKWQTSQPAISITVRSRVYTLNYAGEVAEVNIPRGGEEYCGFQLYRFNPMDSGRFLDFSVTPMCLGNALTELVERRQIPLLTVT